MQHETIFQTCGKEVAPLAPACRPTRRGLGVAYDILTLRRLRLQLDNHLELLAAEKSPGIGLASAGSSLLGSPASALAAACALHCCIPLLQEHVMDRIEKFIEVDCPV